MARFSGKIGYAKSVESTEYEGVWADTVEEKQHYGDIIKDFRRYQYDGQLNENLNISNKFSVVVNDYLNANMHQMKYVVYRGTRWDIISFELMYPRVILSIGGVYNGPIPEPA